MVYFEKSYPAPQCLIEQKEKKGKNYDCKDDEGYVIDRLYKDFHCKCYLCEVKLDPLLKDNQGKRIFHIEHLIPILRVPKKKRVKRIELMCDWRNLLLACARCNSIKGSDEYILDCTNDFYAIDQLISFNYDYSNEHFDFEGTPLVEKKLFYTEPTIVLLNKIHNNGVYDNEILSKDSLKENVIEELTSFNELCTKYLSAYPIFNRKKRLRQNIRENLLNDSPFAAFKRWRILNSKALTKEFGTIVKTIVEENIQCA